jgi:hypothetical protein
MHSGVDFLPGPLTGGSLVYFGGDEREAMTGRDRGQLSLTAATLQRLPDEAL